MCYFHFQFLSPLSSRVYNSVFSDLTRPSSTIHQSYLQVAVEMTSASFREAGNCRRAKQSMAPTGQWVSSEEKQVEGDIREDRLIGRWCDISLPVPAQSERMLKSMGLYFVQQECKGAPFSARKLK